MATAFDAIGHDFETVILEDLCASYKKELHQNCLDAYRNSALYPLLRVMHSGDFLRDLPS
jgi:nicotinamidase-related amidase